MAEPAKSSRDILAEVVDAGKKSLVPHLAEMLKRQAIAEVPSGEERRRFWQRAMTPEQEQQLWQQEMIAKGLTPDTMTPEQATDIGLGIAQQVYPDRFDMSTGEGRESQAEIAMWAKKHAMHGPPDQEQRGAADVQR